MNERHTNREDARLGAALREGFAARDGAARTPRFASLWPDTRGTRSRTIAWRPAFAALAALLVVAGLSWTWIKRSASPDSPAQLAVTDASLAHELSSADYWRVPTDALLAYTAPPLDADLPSASAFEVSLEESLL